MFNINYPVLLLTLHEQNLYPHLFLNELFITHCSLLSSIYVMICETQNCGKKIN